jgi:hypothetical protein
MNEYTLSTGFDVSTASFVDSFDISGQQQYPHAVQFNNDGTKMFVMGGDENLKSFVWEYALGTAFDVLTASYTDNFEITSQETVPSGISFNNDGTKMFIVGYTNDKIQEYSLCTGFDLNTTCADGSSGSGSGSGSDVDPTTDKDVVGLIEAQSQSAKNSIKPTTSLSVVGSTSLPLPLPLPLEPSAQVVFKSNPVHKEYSCILSLV